MSSNIAQAIDFTLPPGLNHDYEVVGRLGSGAYGDVYSPRQKGYPPILVAVKMIKVPSGSDADLAVAQQEMKLLCEIGHKNIVGFITSEYDPHLRRFYLVTEICLSGDLGTVIDRRRTLNQPFQEYEIWRILAELCRGLEVLHYPDARAASVSDALDFPVLHRDIKSPNNGNKIKLADLGCARILEGVAPRSFRGTEGYMSPEVTRGQAYGIESDIWSLGIVVYELCGPNLPFDLATVRGWKAKGFVSKHYKPPPPIDERFSPTLRALVAKMLNWAKSTRPTVRSILAMRETERAGLEVDVRVLETSLQLSQSALKSSQDNAWQLQNRAWLLSTELEQERARRQEAEQQLADYRAGAGKAERADPLKRPPPATEAGPSMAKRFKPEAEAPAPEENEEFLPGLWDSNDFDQIFGLLPEGGAGFEE